MVLCELRMNPSHCFIPQGEVWKTFLEERSANHIKKVQKSPREAGQPQRPEVETEGSVVCPRGGFLRVDSEPGKLWTSQKFLAAPGPARLVTQYTERKAGWPSEESLLSGSQGTPCNWINCKRTEHTATFSVLLTSAGLGQELLQDLGGDRRQRKEEVAG